MLARGNEHSTESCRRLIAAACEEFARHGFAGARVRKIAEAAQVNIAAVNYYFGGKEGLYRAALRHLASQKNGNGAHAKESAVELQRRRIMETLESFTSEHPPALGHILAHETMAPTGNLDAILEQDAELPDLERLRELLREIERLQVAPVPEK